VCPILDYCSETWGFQNYASVNTVQNKAIRIFLGVHRFAPLAAIHGDMGWTDPQVRRHVTMIRFWNRIVDMEDTRLPKIILKWDISLRKNTWSNDVKTIFNKCEMLQAYNRLDKVNINAVWASLHEHFCNKWKDEVNSKPKLRTYKSFKAIYKAEPYVLSFMSRSQRSVISQLRSGILPLAIETGRWNNVTLEERLCKLCNDNSIEDEIHFIFQCPFYNTTRRNFLDHVVDVNPHFETLDNNEKLRFCFQKENLNTFCKYINEIFHYRQCHLYNVILL